MNEYCLNSQERAQITADKLAMRILSVLQRNHRRMTDGSGWRPLYGPYQTLGILEFELYGDRELGNNGVENSFRQKFNEALQILKNAGFIMTVAGQSDQHQMPTEKGMAQDTSTPIIGITSAEDFIQRLQSECGSIDEVARDYFRESFRAAEAKLWLSSTFMLGAASERLIYVLSEHVDHILADAAASARLAGITKVRQRKEWIVDQLPALKRRFPGHKDAFIDIEDRFDTLYTSYRYLRNDAGHPRDTVYQPDPAKTNALLLSFGVYVKSVNRILAIS